MLCKQMNESVTKSEKENTQCISRMNERRLTNPKSKSWSGNGKGECS